MAKAQNLALLGKALWGFLTAEDPAQARLERVAYQMMLIDTEIKVSAEKGKHTKEQNTYLSGVRVRRMDIRLRTIYLYIPKLRKGGYVPFFVTKRKRSEMAPATLAQEAFISGSRRGGLGSWPGHWVSRASRLPRSRSSIKSSRARSNRPCRGGLRRSIHS
jgi:putative transposase